MSTSVKQSPSLFHCARFPIYGHADMISVFIIFTAGLSHFCTNWLRGGAVLEKWKTIRDELDKSQTVTEVHIKQDSGACSVRDTEMSFDIMWFVTGISLEVRNVAIILRSEITI